MERLVKNHIKTLLFSIVLLQFSTLFSQSESILSDMDIEHFSIDDGLPINDINCVKKDMYNVIWLCTNAGLVRYDGYEFEIINRGVNNVALENISLRVLEIVGNTLWAGTEGGLYQLKLDTGEIEYVNLLKSNTKNSIKTFHYDGERLWVGTTNGLFSIKDGEVSNILVDGNIRAIEMAEDNILLLSDYYTNVIKFNIVTGEYFNLNNISKYVLDIYKIKDGFLFATYNDGLIVSDINLNVRDRLTQCKKKSCISSNYVLDIAEHNNMIWIGTRRGLDIYSQKLEKIESIDFKKHISDKYLSNYIRDILFVGDDIWFALKPGGVLNLSKKSIGVEHLTLPSEYTQNISESSVFAIDKIQSEIYLGSYKGLFRYKNNQVSSVDSVNSKLNTDEKRISLFCNIDNELLFIGTRGGAFLYNVQRDNLSSIKLDDNSHEISATYCMESKTYFVSDNNIYSQTLDSLTHIVDLSAHDIKVIRALYIDDLSLYIASSAGLIKYDLVNNTVEIVDGLDRHTISYIGAYNTDIIVATSSGALFELDRETGSALKITLPHALISKAIYDIEVIDEELWVTTSNGIFSYNILTKKYTHYSQSHGLLDKEYNLRGGYYDKDSLVLYAAGVLGISKIDIELFKSQRWKNETLISKIQVTDNSGKVIREIYEPTTSLSVNEGQAIRIFLGRLEAVNRYSSNFKYTINKMFSSYSVDLRANQRAINILDIDANDFSLKLHNYILDVAVTPYFWKRWWAFLTYLILLTLIALYFIRHYREVQDTQASEKFAKSELDLKRRQLASLSHELRTPLNSIIGIIGASNSLGEDARYIKSSAHLLHSLIDNVLNSVSLDMSSKITTEISSFSIAELIGESIDIMSPYLDSSGIHLEMHIDDNVPEFIRSDRTKLQQVLINLIKNVIKHAKTVTRLEISIIRVEDILEINISDDGQGIQRGNEDKIFNVFHKSDTDSSGFGLGLHISKAICNTLGGNLLLDLAYTNGAKFTIVVPCIESTEATPVQITKPSVQPLKRNSFLILEDDPLSIHALKLLLRKVGVTDFFIAENLESFHSRSANEYDVVILDLNFGQHINGIDLAKQLREAGRDGLIFILSAESDSEIKKLSMNYVDDYLIKPLTADDLYQLSILAKH